MQRTLNYDANMSQGEIFWREHKNEITIQEALIRRDYMFLQNWRLNIGTPMADIDVIMQDDLDVETFMSQRNVEYDTGEEVNFYAMIEMKHFNWVKQDDRVDYFSKRMIEIDKWILHPAKHPTGKMAKLANVPFYFVIYYPEQEFGYWQFIVCPINEIAKSKCKGKFYLFSEVEYIKFLYSVRNKKAPERILANRSNNKSIPKQFEGYL